MTIVVVGVIADALGAASQLVTVPYAGPGRTFDVKREFMSSPSTEYRSVQAPEIRVDVDHDRPIGQVKYLELGRGGRLSAVCEIDGSALGEGPWFFSPEILHRRGKDIELRALAVTKNPASVGLGSITPRPGTLADAARTIVFQDGWVGGIVKRAAEYDRERKHGEPITVHDTNRPATPRPADVPSLAPPAGRIEYRSAQHVDVLPGRTIQVLAVPYGIEALVHINGRTVAESFANTAFMNVDKQPRRILATRDHDPTRLIGKVVDLEPFHKEGLVATIRASDTPLARESVELARDEVLDCSIGFQIPAGGEVWEGRNRRRVVKALLREVSLVPEPAYPTRVLDVRGGSQTVS